MSRRPGQNQPPPPASNRQNEYFVPRDGIDREVITADICRYLGNDALVRPGVYESPQTGQVVQGYFITAYRNLTTAMIEDLKADSARWDQERRQQTARNPSGVQYRNSDTHQSRQYYGPSEAPGVAAYQDNARESYDQTPRYPGTGTAGYTGAASGGYGAQSYGGQGGYNAQPSYGNAPPQQQFSPQPADTYPGGTTMGGTGFGQTTTERPFIAQNVNMLARGATDTTMYNTGDPYQPGSRDRLPVASTMAPSQSRTPYVTSGPPAQQGYTQATTSGYYVQNLQNPSQAQPNQFAPVQPQDPFYGRASPAGIPANNPSYGATHDPQYETAPTPRTSAPQTSSQMATSGTTGTRRETRDGRDNRDSRDSVDRTHTDPSRRQHRR